MGLEIVILAWGQLTKWNHRRTVQSQKNNAFWFGGYHATFLLDKVVTKPAPFLVVDNTHSGGLIAIAKLVLFDGLLVD